MFRHTHTFDDSLLCTFLGDKTLRNRGIIDRLHKGAIDNALVLLSCLCSKLRLFLFVRFVVDCDDLQSWSVGDLGMD